MTPPEKPAVDSGGTARPAAQAAGHVPVGTVLIVGEREL